MAEKKFCRKEAISFGWQAMKSNLWFFVGIMITSGLIVYIPAIISKMTEKTHPAVSISTNIISTILNMIISLGLMKIALKFCDNQNSVFSDLFSYVRFFFKYLLSSLLYGIIVTAGIILLVVPGIIWGIKFQFFGYFIVDQGAGPIEALRKSWAITTGIKWDLFILDILLILINVLGVLALLVGLFAALPTTMVASAFVYRKLSAQADMVQAPAAN